MQSVSSKEFEKILSIVEEALLNHTKWHDDLVRRLLCRLPLPDSVMAKDACHHCAFGVWFYGMGDAYVGVLPAFKKIGELHMAMHDSAREVCQKIKVTGSAPELDYDTFRNNLLQFRQELDNFKSKIIYTLENVNSPEGPNSPESP